MTFLLPNFMASAVKPELATPLPAPALKEGMPLTAWLVRAATAVTHMCATPRTRTGRAPQPRSAVRAHALPRSTVGSMNGLSVRYIQFGIFTAHPNRMST